MKLYPLKEDRIISHCGYDEELQTLYVGYTHGGCYTYRPVPKALYQGLLEAAKPWSYFDANIRDRGYTHASSPDDYMVPVLVAKQEALEARQARERQAEQELIQSQQFWTRMNGWQFEHAFASLLQEMHVDVEVTPGSADGGVDIIGKKGPKTIVVQCKNHTNPLGPAAVRDLLGAAFAMKADVALLVATGGFTSGAQSFSKTNSIYLLELRDILALAKGQEHPFRTFLNTLCSRSMVLDNSKGGAT